MNTMSHAESTFLFNASELNQVTASRVSGKPRVWTTFTVWIAAAIMGNLAVIASYILVGVGIGFVMGAQGMDATAIETRVQEVFEQPLIIVLLSLLPFQLGMGLVALIAAWMSPEPLRQRLGVVPQEGRTFGRVVLTTMAGFTVSTALVILIGISILAGEASVDPISAAIANGSWWMTTLLSVVLSTVPAVVEEVLFRGYIQRRLLQRWSPAVSIGLATMLFAAVHMDSLQHMIAVVPLSLVTGLLAYRTNSIKPGMLIHAVHNAAVVAFGALMNVLANHMSEERLGLLVIASIGLMGLLGLPAIILLLRSRPSRRDLPAGAEFSQSVHVGIG
ncbi:MAG: CPBP family intramembrane metalloprotease [Planctomycetaceae bacterium]|nr:CPBP family intramembrane metalloprotease [Planctomycetaceae bacterium]